MRLMNLPMSRLLTHNGGTTPKRQGSLGNVGIIGFVFTNFQADNYGTSSGYDEGNCVSDRTGGEISASVSLFD